MKLLVVFLALLMNLPVQASARSELLLRQFVDSSEADLVRAVIGASGETLSWVNERLKQDGKPPFYCQPKNLALANAQYASILQKYVDENPNTGTITWQAYPAVLLNALIHTFPC